MIKVECSVCFTAYTSENYPQILSCLHTFCKQCIDTINQLNDDQINCLLIANEINMTFQDLVEEVNGSITSTMNPDPNISDTLVSASQNLSERTPVHFVEENTSFSTCDSGRNGIGAAEEQFIQSLQLSMYFCTTLFTRRQKMSRLFLPLVQFRVIA